MEGRRYLAANGMLGPPVSEVLVDAFLRNSSATLPLPGDLTARCGFIVGRRCQQVALRILRGSASDRRAVWAFAVVYVDSGQACRDCPAYKSLKLDGSEDPWTTGAPRSGEP